MEIIGALQLAVGWGDLAGNEDEMMEQLAAIKTLNGLLAWLSECHSPVTPVQEAQLIIDGGIAPAAKNPENMISRMRFELAAAHTQTGDPLLIKDKKFAVTDDNGTIAVAVKQLLEAHGAYADLVTLSDNLEQYDGLIIINAYESARLYSIMEAFALIKKLNPEKVSWIYTFSDLTAHMKQSNDVKMLRRYQGYPGLMKSLTASWNKPNAA